MHSLATTCSYTGLAYSLYSIDYAFLFVKKMGYDLPLLWLNQMKKHLNCFRHLRPVPLKSKRKTLCHLTQNAIVNETCMRNGIFYFH